MLDIIGKKDLRQFLEERVAAHPDKVCLLTEDENGLTESYTFSELNKEINQIANLFIKHKIAKGDKVILQMANKAIFVKVWFALAKVGAVMVPVNTHYIANEFDHLVKTSEATTLICDQTFIGEWKRYMDAGHTFERVFISELGEERLPFTYLDEAASDEPTELIERRELSPEDIMEVLFTSGTTSLPKGALITHANLLWAGFFTSTQGRMNANDILLTTMPNYHVDFQCNALMPIWTVGGQLVMIKKYSAHRFWEQICLYRATITQAIPMILRTLMYQPVKAWERNHCLREILYGLTMANKEYEDFKSRFGVEVLNSWGMTETLVGCITVLPEDDRQFPSVGRPYFGYEAKLVDEDGNICPPGKIGTFMVRGIPGKTLFKGYINNEKATQETLLADGWMMTKDKGRTDENGVYWFVDRAVDLIKRNGENISSSEIERAIIIHPKVAEVAVIGVPDPVRDEEVKAFVRLKEGETMTKMEVVEHCRPLLADFKLPVYVEFRDEFPHTCTGKIVKEHLKKEVHDASDRLI